MGWEGKNLQRSSWWKQWQAHPRVEPIPSWDKVASVRLGWVGAHAGACVRRSHGSFGDRLDPSGVRHHSIGPFAKQFRETATGYTEFVRTRSFRAPVSMAPLGSLH